MQNTLETKQLVSVCLDWRPRLVTTAGCVMYGLDLKQAWRKVISDCKQNFFLLRLALKVLIFTTSIGQGKTSSNYCYK